MTRTWVKFCGITQLKHAQLALELGVDAIGFMFYQPSARYITIEKAAEIVKNIPTTLTTVGVFVNATPEQIKATLAAVPLQMLQFHGDEPAQACRAYNLPYIKAIRMQNDVNFGKLCEEYHDAKALLLDNAIGGSGQCFDWSQIPDELSLPLMLAGGLTSDNIQQAIKTVKPYAVDVSSGIEINKGEKSSAQMRRFMRNIQGVN